MDSKPDIQLNGKRALITGGTRGIGRSISRTLSKAGVQVGSFYQFNDHQADETVAELKRLNPAADAFAIKADISSEADVKRGVDTSLIRLGGSPDILILNAAAGASGELTAMSASDWRAPFDVNVHGAFLMVQAVAPYMPKGGSIVFVSSGAGHDPMEGLSAYGASKAAANHMAFVLAQELGPKGIRVNVVSPGHTYKGEDNPNESPSSYTEQQEMIAQTTALRRIGTAQDVANVVLFFCSDLSAFVTGQWIRVNGGRI